MWILIKSQAFIKHGGLLFKIVNDGDAVYVVTPHGAKIKGVTEGDVWEFPDSGLPPIHLKPGPGLKTMWLRVES